MSLQEFVDTGAIQDVAVHLWAADLGAPQEIGLLRHVRAGSPGVVAFSYSEAWLAAPTAFAIDPTLQLFDGDQYTADGGLAGIFTDSAPDRWGRTLLDRREATIARKRGRRARRLDEWDYLLGVADGSRIGALRFQQPASDRFLDDSPVAVRPMSQLRDLEFWAQEFERRPPRTSSEEQQLAILLAPGSSLGGARPKATFAAEDGSLWIAKFPSREDRYDVGAWEYLLTQLAGRAGVRTVETRLLRLGSEHRTFASRRFDRVGLERRLYASAMTLAVKRDGADAGYLDVAQAIEQYGDPASIEADLEQLYRRVVLNVLAGNRDDHLRNHGFLRTPEGWRLAPAFDLNPASRKADHTLAIDESTRTPDLSVVLETAPYYRLGRTTAQELVNDIRSVLSSWRTLAQEIDLTDDEVELLASEFEPVRGTETVRNN